VNDHSFNSVFLKLLLGDTARFPSFFTSVTKKTMLKEYAQILILMVIVFGFAGVTLLLSAILGQKKKSETKLMPYECGIDPVGTARQRFSIKFYVTTMIFILFDIEALYLYPWAVIYRRLGVFGLVEMGVFILLLLVGFIYVWKKGAFEWD
jgi:NADH-quinone oxidoreductase subunit A